MFAITILDVYNFLRINWVHLADHRLAEDVVVEAGFSASGQADDHDRFIFGSADLPVSQLQHFEEVHLLLGLYLILHKIIS